MDAGEEALQGGGIFDTYLSPLSPFAKGHFHWILESSGDKL